MDRKELFAHVDVWDMNHGFSGTRVNDWEDIFHSLLNKGFTFEEAAELLNQTIALLEQERQ